MKNEITYLTSPHQVGAHEGSKIRKFESLLVLPLWLWLLRMATSTSNFHHYLYLPNNLNINSNKEIIQKQLCKKMNFMNILVILKTNK